MERKNKVGIIIIGCIFFAISILMFILGATIFDGKGDKEIFVKEEIEVSSTVQNSITQEYISTITGTICNNTDSELTNIEIVVNVETSFLHNKGKFTIYIDKLDANAEHAIFQEFESIENFETVLSTYASVDGKNSFTLEEKAENFYIIIGAVMIVAGFIPFLALIKKPKSNHEEEKDISPEDSIEDLEEKLKKEKLKKELKSYLNTNTTCKYCGHQNSSKSTKCESCGASIVE